MGIKISNLPAIVTPALADVFPVVQSGVTYKETFTQLSSLFATSGANANITSLSGLTTPLSIAQGGTGSATGIINATTFTPTFTFGTPGDLTVVYAVQAGYYWRVGNLVLISYAIRFTPTYTTSAGNVILAGLPVAANSSAVFRLPAVISESTTWPASTTQIYASISNTSMTLLGEGTGTATANFTVTHITSGVEKTITISGSYGG